MTSKTDEIHSVRMIKICRVLPLTSLFIQSVLCYIFAIAVCATPYYYCLIQFAINVDCPSGWTIRLRLLRLYSFTDCRYIDRKLWESEYERFKSVMLSVMKIFHSAFPQMFQFSMMVFKSKFSRLFLSWPYNKLQNQ